MAKYDDKMGHVFTPDGRIYPEEELHLALIFDQTADLDAAEIELDMKQKALLRKVCWLKIVSYPFEVALTYLFLGKGWAKERVEQHGTYRKFLKGKMSIVDFNTELMNISNKYLKEKSPDA